MYWKVAERLPTSLCRGGHPVRLGLRHTVAQAACLNAAGQCYSHWRENHHKQRETGPNKTKNRRRVRTFPLLQENRWPTLVWVFALLCGGQLSAAECTTDTAIDVIRFPDAQNETACVQGGMMTVASLAIQAGPDEYWKFVCTRPQSQDAASLAQRTEVLPP